MIKPFFTLIALFFLSAFVPIQKLGNGKSIPSVMLKDLKGNNINSSEFSKNGKINIICFWATWCKPCVKELNNMKDLYKEWKEKYNVNLIAVSIDDSKTSMRVGPVVKAKGWDYTVLLDINEDFKRAMGVNTAPHSFMTDKNGIIIYEHEGYIEGDEFILQEEILKAVEKGK